MKGRGGATPRRRAGAAALVVAASLLAASCSGGTPAAQPSPAEPTPSDQSVEPRPTITPAPTVGPETRLERRPNVLVIEADDMRADDLRFMPRTRRLIGDAGLTWHNSFAPNPLCCPSRASFLTGEYSHNHGVLSHVEPYGFHSFEDSRTIATALHGAGYRTALVGKYLNGYGVQPTHDGANSLLYVPPGWTDWLGSVDSYWSLTTGRQASTYDYFDLATNHNGSIETFPDRYTTDVTSEQTQGLIRSYTRRADDRPWFVWWTPVAPHHGNPIEPDDPGTTPTANGGVDEWLTPARPEWVKGLFDSQVTHAAGVPAEGSSEADRRDKPRFLRHLAPMTQVEKDAGAEVTRQRGEALYVLDGQVARTLATLRRTGAAKDTVVVFTSDNGYYLGEHEKRQGKINLHEPSIRVPLLMSGPGIPRGERFDPITTIDLTATLSAITGAHLRGMDGSDLRQVIRDGDQGWVRPVVLEGRMLEPTYLTAGMQHPEMSGLNNVGIRVGRWKYVRYSTGETELYDLLKDPLELRSSSAESPVRTALERVWDASVDCAGDACRLPLPPALRASPGQERRLTLRQQRVDQSYYDREPVR